MALAALLEMADGDAALHPLAASSNATPATAPVKRRGVVRS
ncbi:MAG: hypothetical protein WEE67_10490 [Chloroflexota bacterium]